MYSPKRFSVSSSAACRERGFCKVRNFTQRTATCVDCGAEMTERDGQLQLTREGSALLRAETKAEAANA